MTQTSRDPGALVPSVIAVLGAVVVIGFLDQALEFTLVNAVAGEPVRDMSGYFAVRNRPGILAGKLAYTAVVGLLAGYLCAKVAGRAERTHAAVAAALQCFLLLRGLLTTSEYSSLTPGWLWVALMLVIVPSMLTGATVRERARLAGGSSEAGPR